MIRVRVEVVKSIKSVMEIISRRTLEVLNHFKCIFCKKWWSIGDAPLRRKKFYCPWCGKINKYK